MTSNVPLKVLEECCGPNYLIAYCKDNNIAYGDKRWPRIEKLLTAAIANMHMQSYIQAESTDEELIQWTENPPTLEETQDIPSEVEIIDFEEIPELDDVVRALDLATRRSLL